MADRPNLVLVGKTEPIDPVRPEVRAMIENEGLYIGGDTRNPGMAVPLASLAGEIWSMRIDKRLDPTGFLDTLTLHGPYFAEPPQPDVALRGAVIVLDRHLRNQAERAHRHRKKADKAAAKLGAPQISAERRAEFEELLLKELLTVRSVLAAWRPTP